MILLFTTSKRAVSRAIRAFTGDAVSHVAFLEHVGGVPVVLHADVGGVQFTSLRTFTADNAIVRAYQRNACMSSDEYCGIAHAVEALGTPYDYTSLFVRAVAIALRWMGFKFRSPLRSPRAVVCSEFVARTVGEFSTYDPEAVTPGDLLLHCEGSDQWAPFVVTH